MYASIRRYRTSKGAGATSSVRRHFTHALKQAPGLVAYYVIESAAEEEWTTVSVFESRQAAERSDQLAADYVLREGVGELVGEPQIAGGEVTVVLP